MSRIPGASSAMPRIQSNWDWRAAGNFIGGGSGAGLLAAGFLAGPSGLPVWPVALVGGILIGLGLGCVWLEIGKPWRAVNVFFHPQTSWMTREGILALFLYVVGSGAVLFDSAAFLGVMAAIACGFAYCQARILTAAKGIPAWRDALVTPLILVTAGVEGCGLGLLLALAQGWSETAGLSVALLALLGARALVWRGYVRRLGNGKAPVSAADAARAMDRPMLLLGHALPILLLAAGQPGLAAIGGALAVGGGWLLKYVLVTRLSATRGFSMPVTPARGRGTAGPGVQPGWGGAK